MPPDLHDRVRKLLALATSPNVHEAAAAAAAAQALVERHRLETWLAAEVTSVADPVTDGREAPLEAARRLRKWKIALAAGLADANGCLAYTAVVGDETLLLLAGRAADRQAVADIWGWLVTRLEWLSATHGQGRPRASATRGQGAQTSASRPSDRSGRPVPAPPTLSSARSRAWHEAFRIGAAEVIVARLAATSTEVEATLPPAALVRIEPVRAARAAEVEAFAATKLHLGRGRGLRVDARGLASGRRAGEQVVLPRR